MGHRAALPLSSIFHFFIKFVITTLKSRSVLLIIFYMIMTVNIIDTNSVLCLPQKPGQVPQQKLIKCHTTNMTKTFCILDNKQEETIFTADNVPERSQELKLNGGKELYLTKEIFIKTKILRLLQIENNSKVTLSSGTFINQLTNGILNIRLLNIGVVLFETNSLKTMANLVVRINITNAKRVIIQPNAFYELDSIHVYNVSSLELQKDSFRLMQPQNVIPTPVVELDKVTLKELPKGGFPTALASMTLRNCKIGHVSSESLTLIMMHEFTLDSCSVDVWGSRSFNSDALIDQFHISNSRLKTVEANAFNPGGGSVLSIQHSMINNVYSGAFNMTVPRIILINNTFERIRNMGFTLTKDSKDSSWRHMEMENNTFKKLEMNSFDAPYSMYNEDGNKVGVFVFRRNLIHNAAISPFNLSIPNDVNITISDNYFGEICNCNVSTLMRNIFLGSSENISRILFETSKCHVTYLMSRCFNMPQGYTLMRNFTDSVCDLMSKDCEEIVNDEVGKLPFNPPWPYDEEMMKETKVLHWIIIIAIICVFILVIMTSVMWLYRNGYFTKGRILLFISTESLFNLICRLCVSSTGVTRSNSAHSISRISVHEYAELHGQKIQIETEEEEIPSEDKGTQTLPEELTQELLQSLREKLDDPENYSEARDMIEHLYDLIKVEESCNKNYNHETTINFDDFDIPTDNHVYDEIKPSTGTKTRSLRSNKSKKILVTVGTRAPSPDRLLPAKVAYGEARRRSMMLGDYSEPKDKKDQTHEYSELPGGGKSPTTKTPPKLPLNESSSEIVKQNIVSNIKPLFILANRPLPEKPDPGEGPSTSSSSS